MRGLARIRRRRRGPDVLRRGRGVDPDLATMLLFAAWAILLALFYFLS